MPNISNVKLFVKPNLAILIICMQAVMAGEIFMSDNRNGVHVSNAVTNSLWFKRFIQSSYQRMGDI